MKYVISFLAIAAFVIFYSCGDDGIFSPPVQGCTNPDAANYDSLAVEDDGSCILPDKKVRPMIIEYTSKCCPPCGQWGHETFERVYTTYGKDVVPMAFHTNLQSCTDPMLNPTLLASITKYFPTGGGIPSFYFGNAKTTDTTIIDKYLTYDPMASAAFTAVKSGNKIIIKTVTHFYDNPDGDKYFGDFNINAFAVESKIDGSENASAEYNQAGNEDDVYYHNYVVRASANPNGVYGYRIVESEVADNAVIHKDLEIELDPSWIYSHINVVVILWYKQNNGTYRFLNAVDNRN